MQFSRDSYPFSSHLNASFFSLYVEQLGFALPEDQMLGEYRWLIVRAPRNKEVSINLEIAKTEEEKSLIGRQGAAKPLLGISTDDCKRDYVELKRRGVRFEGEPKVMPYGTGVMLQDLYGNKIYLNQDHACRIAYRRRRFNHHPT